MATTTFRPAFFLITTLLTFACGGRIVVPLRICVVRGSALAQAPDIENTVNSFMDQVNYNIWHPDADIHFLPTVDQSTKDHFLVIDDPGPPGPDIFGVNGYGSLGDIYVKDHSLATTEMQAAYTACTQTWLAPPNTVSYGLVAIVARDLVGLNGSPAASNGAGPGHSTTLVRNGGKDLCIAPRHLTAQDLAGQYALVAEPKQFNPGARQGPFVHVLAHELGHTLLLGHGDGLDNNSDAAPPPGPGARLFDVDCDPAEQDAAASLMSAEGAVSDIMSSFQRELARTSAALVPGSIGGPP